MCWTPYMVMQYLHFECPVCHTAVTVACYSRHSSCSHGLNHPATILFILPLSITSDPPSPTSTCPPQIVFASPQPQCPVCNVYVAIAVTFLITLLFLCLTAALIAILVAWRGRRRRKNKGHYDVQQLAAEQ